MNWLCEQTTKTGGVSLIIGWFCGKEILQYFSSCCRCFEFVASSKGAGYPKQARPECLLLLLFDRTRHVEIIGLLKAPRFFLDIIRNTIVYLTRYLCETAKMVSMQNLKLFETSYRYTSRTIVLLKIDFIVYYISFDVILCDMPKPNYYHGRCRSTIIEAHH
jgi:hypothetical protein